MYYIYLLNLPDMPFPMFFPKKCRQDLCKKKLILLLHRL